MHLGTKVRTKRIGEGEQALTVEHSAAANTDQFMRRRTEGGADLSHVRAHSTSNPDGFFITASYPFCIMVLGWSKTSRIH